MRQPNALNCSGVSHAVDARKMRFASTKPDATPFRQATQSVYEEFYVTPAGKDAKKMVDYILAIK